MTILTKMKKKETAKMIKQNWDKFKEKFLQFDNWSTIFSKTFWGRILFEKILFRSKSFYSALLFILPYLIWEIRAYNYGKHWQKHVNEKIQNSEGFINFMWQVSDFFVPEGSLLLIIILAVVLIYIFWREYKIIGQKTIEDILLKPLREKAKNVPRILINTIK